MINHCKEVTLVVQNGYGSVQHAKFSDSSLKVVQYSTFSPIYNDEISLLI
jgi:hypothetical protein